MKPTPRVWNLGCGELTNRVSSGQVHTYALLTGYVSYALLLALLAWRMETLIIRLRLHTHVLDEEVTETTWTCKRDAGTQTQERARTTMTDIQGVVSGVVRERNQVAGFNLNGYSGTPTMTSTTDGPAVGSCPTNWSVIQGPDTETISSETHLQVSNDGTNWFNLT